MRTARIAGFLVGAAIAVVLLWGNRPAAGGESVGATLTVQASLTGELLVDPVAPVPLLRDPAMRPGETPVTGTFEVTNQTGDPLAIRLRALPSSDALDSQLQMDIRSGDTTLRSGLLGSLRAPGGEPLVLEPAASGTVQVTAYLPAGGTGGWEAAVTDVAIHFDMKDAAG